MLSLQAYSEAKVAYLNPHVVIYESIANFQVSVQNLIILHKSYSLNHLLHKVANFDLR